MSLDLVVVGGFDGADFYSRVEASDTRAGRGRQLAPMAEPRAYGSAACCDGQLYAMGGMCGVVRPPGPGVVRSGEGVNV